MCVLQVQQHDGRRAQRIADILKERKALLVGDEGQQEGQQHVERGNRGVKHGVGNVSDHGHHQEIDQRIGDAVGGGVGQAGFEVASDGFAGQAGGDQQQDEGGGERDNHEFMGEGFAQCALLHVLHDGADAVSDEGDHGAEKPLEGELFLPAGFEIDQHDGGEDQSDAGEHGRRGRLAQNQAVAGGEDERAGDNQRGERHRAEAQRKHRARPCGGIADGKAQRVGNQPRVKLQIKARGNQEEAKRNQGSQRGKQQDVRRFFPQGILLLGNALTGGDEGIQKEKKIINHGMSFLSAVVLYGLFCIISCSGAKTKYQ